MKNETSKHTLGEKCTCHECGAPCIVSGIGIDFFDETAAERDRLKEEVERLNEAIDIIADRNRELEFDRDNIKSHYDQEIDRLKEENERLKKFKDNLESGAEQFARVAKQRDQLKEENEKLNAKLIESEKQNAETQQVAINWMNKYENTFKGSCDLSQKFAFVSIQRDKLQSLNAELVEVANQAIRALERYGNGNLDRQEDLDLTEAYECLMIITTPKS